LKPKKKVYKHIFDNKTELKKCKNDPLYFYEKYWLPYSQREETTIRDTERILLESYWND